MPFPRFLAVVVVLVIASLSPFNPVGISSFHKVYAATRTILLVGHASTGWNSTPANPTITITEGDTVVITTSSGDLAPHRFFVDVNGGGMTPDCSVDKCAHAIPPTFTDTLTGFSQGSYTYYCEYHPAMTGSFVVQAPPPDFIITPNPSSLTLNQGSSQTSILTVSSLNGFSGTVTFSAPSAPNGISAVLSSSTTSVTPSSPGSTTLNVTVGSSTPRTSYTVSITGSGGGNSHTVSVNVVVVGPDFGISSDQSSISIVVGSSGNATIILMSQNGFAGDVNLTATVSPAGLVVSFNPDRVSLTSGGSARSVLRIATSSGLYSSTATGGYTIVVTGNGNPSLLHSATMSVTVTSPSSPSSPIPLSVVAIAVAGILVAASVVAFAVLRKKSGK